MFQKTETYRQNERIILRGQKDKEYRTTEEFQKAVKYFNVLKYRGEIDVAPQKQNNYTSPILKLNGKRPKKTVVSYPKLVTALETHVSNTTVIQSILGELDK